MDAITIVGLWMLGCVAIGVLFTVLLVAIFIEAKKVKESKEKIMFKLHGKEALETYKLLRR